MGFKGRHNSVNDLQYIEALGKCVCLKCGNLVETGVMNIMNHFDECEENNWKTAPETKEEWHKWIEERPVENIHDQIFKDHMSGLIERLFK